MARKKRRRGGRTRNQRRTREQKPTTAPAQDIWAIDQSDDRGADPLEAADALRKEMELQSLRIRDLILAQPPIPLLGHLIAQLHLGYFATSEENDGSSRAERKNLLNSYQLALEYVHAVWCCHTPLADEATPLDQEKVGELFEALDALKHTTGLYCLSSSRARADRGRGEVLGRTEFQAKLNWVLIRGNRYQVLEEEFFRFVLGPHSDALQREYGVSAQEIAAEIQATANSMRVGFSEAVELIDRERARTEAIANDADIASDAAIAKLRAQDRTFTQKISNAIHDIFYGGICNLSRHTRLPPLLLEDLSYVPGQNTEFFAEGDFRGTPMRTLPARVKPGVRLGDDYYVTDGQFVRDAAYRAIQRGLLRRAPSYREEWNKRQKELVEQAFPSIFRRQLNGATLYSEVYFKDADSGQWVETDLVMAFADVLFVVEAKAGVTAMHSPATDFHRHERSIQALIIKAYEQCRRFVGYLAASKEASIYKRVETQFVEVGRLRRHDYRVILPIGLTVEAFTPFSAMSKQMPEIRPLLGAHPFVSMSVDDLFVLNRFLPTAGELMHYFEVRQQVAGIPRAFLFDEIEHLGAYLHKNRFDMSIREQLAKAEMVTWDSFGEIVDKYFEEDTWKTQEPPSQPFPEMLVEIFRALDRHRPDGWLRVDSHIRTLRDEGRDNLAGMVADLKQTLPEFPKRRFLIGGDGVPLLVWLCRSDYEPSLDEMRYYGQVSCLVVSSATVIALRLSLDDDETISDVESRVFSSPSAILSNYPELLREAERQRRRLRELSLRKNVE